MVRRQTVTTTPLSHWTLRKRSTDLLDRDELGVARAMTTSFLWALDKHGMTDDSKKDVLAILYSLKEEIIRV